MTTIKGSSNPNDSKDAPVYTQLIPKLLMKDIVFRNECHRLQSFFPSKMSSLQQLGAFSNWEPLGFLLVLGPSYWHSPGGVLLSKDLSSLAEVTPIMLRFVTLRNGSG
ncbi:hypothetical protein CDAR_85651 [Caerostris darwini]|uniref:Uncharacterized protein n=1 Tax=Caerostris darwini TaxID=1538125 RepID=A0AAV4QJ45_9ARAC|nr:hypothetical protein CDAR_85651 [Caerostris darwini]